MFVMHKMPHTSFYNFRSNGIGDGKQIDAVYNSIANKVYPILNS